MGLLGHLIGQQLKPTDARGSESGIVHANPMGRAEQPSQTAEDAQQPMGAGTVANVGDMIDTVVTRAREVIPETILEDSETVVAYIREIIPIPWLAGDQPMTGNGRGYGG